MNNAQQTKSNVTYESVISALLMSTDVILDNQIHQISPISKDFMICEFTAISLHIIYEYSSFCPILHVLNISASFVTCSKTN